MSRASADGFAETSPGSRALVFGRWEALGALGSGLAVHALSTNAKTAWASFVGLIGAGLLESKSRENGAKAPLTTAGQ